MRFRSILFFWVFIFFSSSVIADNTLSVASGVSIIAVNGYEINKSSLFGHEGNIVLPNGKNQILVQYTQEIKSSGSFEIENSDLHVLDFSADNQEISLLVPDIKRLSEFRQFNGGELWLLKDSSGQLIEYVSQPLLKEGLQINRDYERELQEFNSAGGDVAINNSMGSQKLFLSINNSNKSDSVSLAKTMLMYWYSNADIDTRKSFKSWISDK